MEPSCQMIKEKLRYSYLYNGFTIFIRPTGFANYGEPNWRADEATPTEWGYRIDQIPGKLGIAGGDGYASVDVAENAAEERIDSWN